MNNIVVPSSFYKGRSLVSVQVGIIAAHISGLCIAFYETPFILKTQRKCQSKLNHVSEWFPTFCNWILHPCRLQCSDKIRSKTAKRVCMSLAAVMATTILRHIYTWLYTCDHIKSSFICMRQFAKLAPGHSFCATVSAWVIHVMKHYKSSAICSSTAAWLGEMRSNVKEWR